MVTVEEFNDADDDLYALLGVPATATVEEIRNGYKEKALLHHPDRGGDPFAWTRIAQAYDTLNGPRRAAYDKTRRVATGGAESEFAQSFGDGAFDLSEGKPPAERKAEKASAKEGKKVPGCGQMYVSKGTEIRDGPKELAPFTT